MTYYSEVMMQSPATNQTRTWAISLTELVFFAVEIFVLKVKDKACSTHYKGNLLFDHVSGGPPFRLPARILDGLVYFGLYECALRMKGNYVVDSLCVEELHRGALRQNWYQGQHFGYNFTAGDMLGFQEESVLVGKRVYSSGGSSITLIILVATMFFQADRGRVSVSDVQRD